MALAVWRPPDSDSVDENVNCKFFFGADQRPPPKKETHGSICTKSGVRSLLLTCHMVRYMMGWHELGVIINDLLVRRPDQNLPGFDIAAIQVLYELDLYLGFQSSRLVSALRCGALSVWSFGYE